MTEQNSSAPVPTADNNIRYELMSQEGDSRMYYVRSPANPILDDAEAKIQEEMKTFSMAGFPPGRVPEKIARKHLGEKIISSVVDKHVAQMLQYVVVMEELTISSPPDIDIKKFDKDADFECEIKLQVVEGIPQLDYNHPELQNTVSKLSLKVEESDIDKAMAELSKEFNASFIDAPADHAVAMGDKLLIDFDGRVDAKPFEGGNGTNISLVLGEGKFIPEIERQIVGMKAGENKIIKANFPANYHISELVNKEGVFKITLHSASIKSASDEGISSEVLEKFGMKDISELREMISMKLKIDFEAISELIIKKQIFDIVDKIVDFEVPASMIQSDFKNLWTKVVPNVPKEALQGNPKDKVPEIMDIARKRIKMGLVLSDIARRHEIKVLDEDIDNARKLAIMQNPAQEDEINEQYSSNNKSQVEAMVLESKVLEFLCNCIPLVEKEVTPKEFEEDYKKYLEEDLFTKPEA